VGGRKYKRPLPKVSVHTAGARSIQDKTELRKRYEQLPLKIAATEPLRRHQQRESELWRSRNKERFSDGQPGSRGCGDSGEGGAVYLCSDLPGWVTLCWASLEVRSAGIRVCGYHQCASADRTLLSPGLVSAGWVGLVGSLDSLDWQTLLPPSALQRPVSDSERRAPTTRQRQRCNAPMARLAGEKADAAREELDALNRSCFRNAARKLHGRRLLNRWLQDSWT
jgi:hypothetical protein